MPFPQDFNLQRNSIDSLLAQAEKIPSSLNKELLQRVMVMAKQPQLLVKSFTELHVARQQIQQGVQAETLKLSNDTDAGLGFSNLIQSRLVASRAINADEPEFIREDIVTAIDELLHCIAAVSSSSVGQSLEQVEYRYSARYIVHESLKLWLSFFLATEVVQQEDIGKPSYSTWIPLTSIKQLSASELLRLILRTTIVDPQVDNDISSLLYQLTKGVHLEWSPQVSPEQLLWRHENDMLEWVNAQTTRDRVGAQFAPYLAKLLSGSAEAYDPEFHAAFNVMLQAVQLYYQSLPTTAAVQSAANTPAPAPAVTPPAPTSAPQQIPINTPTTTQPVSTTPTTTEPVPVPGATVDLRTAQPTPPTPPSQPAPATSQTTGQPPADQPRIKPLNLP